MKNKRTVKPKKNHQKINDESISCPSEEDDSSNGGGSGSGSAMVPLPPALNLNGKTRANRGSATDPQSLYARVGKTSSFFLSCRLTICNGGVLLII